MDVDARGAVQTRRRTTVHGVYRRRSVFGDVVGAVGCRAVSASVDGDTAELTERAAVSWRTAARERVQTVDTRSPVETRSAQLLTVIDVHVTSTSGIAECADAPETVTLIDTATYTTQYHVVQHCASITKLNELPSMCGKSTQQ